MVSAAIRRAISSGERFLIICGGGGVAPAACLKIKRPVDYPCFVVKDGTDHRFISTYLFNCSVD